MTEPELVALKDRLDEVVAELEGILAAPSLEDRPRVEELRDQLVGAWLRLTSPEDTLH